MMPKNKNFVPQKLKKGRELGVRGVVTNVIHKLG